MSSLREIPLAYSAIQIVLSGRSTRRTARPAEVVSVLTDWQGVEALGDPTLQAMAVRRGPSSRNDSGSSEPRARGPSGGIGTL
jgi:hypothetical protein